MIVEELFLKKRNFHPLQVSCHGVMYLTIILRENGTSPDTLPTRPYAELSKIRRYSARLHEQDNCFIIQYIDDKAQFSTFLGIKDGKTTIFLRDTQNYVYRRIYVEYVRRILSAL